MCQLINVDKILGVATAAVRNAKNGADFLASIAEQTGISLKTISGSTEAWLGFAGMINTLDITDAVLFDLGGGSFEVTLVKNRKPIKSASIPFGAVNLTERFGTQDKINEATLHELYAFIMKQLARHPWLAGHSFPLVGIGGTARNIAKMVQKRNNYPFNKVHNYRLGIFSLNDLWQTLANSD